MKTLPPGTLALALLLLAPLATAETPATAAPTPIGAIIDMKDRVELDRKMSVDYSYGPDLSLVLVIRGVEMNGAAGGGPKPSVAGDLLLQGNQIKILPKEIFAEKDPGETIKSFSLRYIIPKVQPGIYRLFHDDSATEGADQVIDLSLDLRKPVKKTLIVAAKAVSPPPAPATPPPPPPVIKEDP